MSNISLKELPPLSLYIHIPWCVRKCPYCDFNSHAVKDNIPEDKYIDCLIKDAESVLPLIWGRTIQSIFIGGGTPSLFSGHAIDKLLVQLRMRFSISPYAEITLEANPGTVEQIYIGEYADAGVNRISLGVQSFNDKYLKKLGRIHSTDETEHAIRNITDHFNNFNLDIMYGLPDQTIVEASHDIKTAISFSPTHISAYNLTIEPNTEFAKKTPKNIPDDDVCYQMQDNIINLLHEHDYHRYEISAYAKDKYHSRHNTNYWQFGDYIGIGAGAHSKLSFHDKIIRQMRHKHPSEYMQKVPTNSQIQSTLNISAEELPFEFMMNALRLTNGFSTTLFNQTTGVQFNQIIAKILKAQQEGYISLEINHLKPTQKGSDFLNNLLEIFM